MVSAFISALAVSFQSVHAFADEIIIKRNPEEWAFGIRNSDASDCGNGNTLLVNNITRVDVLRSIPKNVYSKFFTLLHP